MSLVPVGRSDITVESTADGYSEALTVENGDSVHVDSHAEASASATASIPFSGTFNIDANGHRKVIHGVPFGSAHIDATVGPSPNADEGEAFAVDVRESDGAITNTIIDSGWIDVGETKSWSGTVESISEIRIRNNGQDAIEFQFDITVTQLGSIASATIDSTSVVTDDIHKNK